MPCRRYHEPRLRCAGVEPHGLILRCKARRGNARGTGAVIATSSTRYRRRRRRRRRHRHSRPSLSLMRDRVESNFTTAVLVCIVQVILLAALNLCDVTGGKQRHRQHYCPSLYETEKDACLLPKNKKSRALAEVDGSERVGSVECTRCTRWLCTGLGNTQERITGHLPGTSKTSSRETRLKSLRIPRPLHRPLRTPLAYIHSTASLLGARDITALLIIARRLEVKK